MFFLLTFQNKEEKILRIFKNLNFFTKLKHLKHIFIKFLSFINLPCGHVMSHKKFGPDRFSRFDVYWIQTNGQTDRQAKFIYRRNFEFLTKEICSSKQIEVCNPDQI